ncbi:MAG: hypothetical protein U0694_01350 [Anaerolineae bacterium]
MPVRRHRVFKVCYAKAMIARGLLLISGFFLLLFGLLILSMLLLGAARHGRELAFVREESVDFSFNLYLMDVDYGLTTRLTRRALWYDNFDWSPDGQQLAVELVTRDSEDLIFLLNMRGEDSLLTTGRQPAWSPDGTTLAYVTRGAAGYDIMTLDLTSIQRHDLGSSTSAQASPTWSPDGRWLAYTMGIDIPLLLLVDTQGSTAPRQIAYSTDMLWSADSRTLTYTAYRNGDYDVYSVNLDTGAEQTLTDTLEDERYPVWSPDGTRLAYVATYGYADFLRILYADGAVYNIDLSALIGHRVYIGELPVWSADGRQMVLSLITPSVPNAYNLYLLTLDGRNAGHSAAYAGWTQ